MFGEIFFTLALIPDPSTVTDKLSQEAFEVVQYPDNLYISSFILEQESAKNNISATWRLGLF